MIDPEARSPEKRIQILRGAAIVFAQDGYEGASMSRIARASSVSKGTLYNHFQSKAALFRSYLEQSFRRNLAEVFEEIPAEVSTTAGLGMIGRRMVAMMLTPERRCLYRMVISEAGSFPELAQAFYETGPQAAVQALTAWIDGQADRGRLRVTDRKFAAEQFFALCQTRLWMRYRLYLQDQPSDAELEQVVGAAVETFLARYAVEGPT